MGYVTSKYNKEICLINIFLLEKLNNTYTSSLFAEIKKEVRYSSFAIKKVKENIGLKVSNL